MERSSLIVILFVVTVFFGPYLVVDAIEGDDRPAATTPTPTPEPTATPTMSVEERHERDRRAIQQAVLEAINEYRVDEGLAPLELSPPLSEVAREHSRDMIRDGYYNHTAPDGQTFQPACRPTAEIIVRVSTVGFDGSRVASEAMEQWTESESHRDIIRSRMWSRTGIGVGLTAGGDVYLTQNFC